jgi:hypothetical protein
MELIAREFLAGQAAQNIVYSEVTWTPLNQYHTSRMGFAEQLAAINRALFLSFLIVIKNVVFIENTVQSYLQYPLVLEGLDILAEKFQSPGHAGAVFISNFLPEFDNGFTSQMEESADIVLDGRTKASSRIDILLTPLPTPKNTQ